MPASVLRVFTSSLLWCAPVLAADPIYEVNDPPVTSVKALDDKRLDQVIANELKAKGLTAKNAATGSTGLDGLSREVKQALLMTVSMKPGSEQDLMVEAAGGTYTPVQVLWDDATLVYSVGAPRAVYGVGPSKEELQRRYGVGAFVDDGAAWDSDLLFSVDLALSKLTKEELALIAGTPFHRLPKDSKGGPERKLAVYRQDSTLPEPRFEVYDASKEVDRVRFCGTIDAPVTQSAAMVMHEVAHAISRATAGDQMAAMKTARKALEDATTAFNEGQKKYNADRAEYARSKDPELRKSLEARAAATKDEVAKVKELQKVWQDLQTATQKGLQQSPSEAALLQRLPLNKAPTPYARTLGSEAFAESFRLWKLDRAALDRAAPGISTWFDSPAYSSTLKKP
ncbi:MAG: hypothetical protein JNJ54_01630 [Myxococcaceae bacterium]|nr:hypothetical protein [Myxococcaceae bacterium]